jgi:hypothetical protein
MTAAYPNSDEDFRKRYSAETAGMPANLAAIASKNLAAEDALLAKVNAAGRLNPTPVTDSAFATPQTNAENAGIVTAMQPSPVATSGQSPTLEDAHVADILQRRSAISDQMNTIKTRLGIVLPTPGTAVVLAPQGQHRDLLGQLDALEREDRNLLSEHHDISALNTRNTTENFARQMHILTQDDNTSLANDLLKIQQDPNIKPGTDDHFNAVLSAASKHPYATQSESGRMLLRGTAAVHDNAAALKDRAYSTRFNQAFKEASQVARKHGVDVQYDNEGFPSIDLTAKSAGASAASESVPANVQSRYAKLQADAQMHEELSAKEAAANVDKKSDKYANIPYSKAPLYHATKAEMAQLEKRFPGLATDSETDAGSTALAPTVPTATPTISPADQAAISWATANPKDPRAIAIKKLHGIQ